MPPFRYKPNQNRYVGSIADLMGRGNDAEAQALITSANAQAQAAQASGQAWGGAVQGIGNTIAAIPGQMQAQQDRAYAVTQRERLAEQQGREDRELENKEKASALFARHLTGDSQDPLASTVGFRPTHGDAAEQAQHPYQVEQDGGWVFDIESFQRAAAGAGPGVLEHIDGYVDQMEGMNNMRRAVVELGRTEARNQATWLTNLPDEQLLLALPAEIRVFKGVVDQGLLDSLTGLVEQGDAVGIRSALNGYIGKPDQFISTRPGQDIRNMSTGEVIAGQDAVVTPEGSPIAVNRNGENVLVQPMNDGTFRDLPPGMGPPTDTPRVEGLDVLVSPDGTQRYVRKGSPEAQELLNSGWTVHEDAVAPQPPSQAQFLASAYAGRMVQAGDVFGKISDEIVDMWPASFTGQKWADTPTLQSDVMQSYMQASRNFINALLRRESGAVIADSEFDSAEKQYLPMPNDSEVVARQKAANRQYVTDTMIRSSGDAYEAPGGLSGDFTTQWDYDPDTQQNRLTYWHDGADGGIAGWYYDPPNLPHPQGLPGTPLSRD